MFHCLVVGSRSFENYELMERTLDNLLKNHRDIEIVSGGAYGADALAERYAKEKGYELKVFKADWKKYGKRAGIIRNEEMQKYISQFEHRGCVAFWDGQSRGPQSSFEMAEKYGNSLKVIRI